MIMRTGVKRENADQRRLLLSREMPTQIVREIHLQLLPLRIVRKACAGIGVSIRIRDIGFHIVDGCSVHKVCPQHMNHALLHPVYPYAGEPQSVRTKGRAGGKHAHALVTAQSRRTHGKRSLGSRLIL